MTRLDITKLCLVFLLGTLTLGHVFARSELDITLLGPVLLNEEQEVIQSWNQTTEDLVKLYLDAKEMIRDGSANFTEEQISKFEKNADNYYLSDIKQANETLTAIYVGFMIAGVLIWIISTVVLVFNERKYKALHYVRQKVADYLVESQEG